MSDMGITADKIVPVAKAQPDVIMSGQIYAEKWLNPETVDHPEHYGGEDNPYEVIKVIEAWGLGFHLGNTIKYVARAGKKNPDREIEDLRKALWYLERRINNLIEERDDA